MTKLDDLRLFLKNKDKKKDAPASPISDDLGRRREKDFSLEVSGSESSHDPMASFGTDESDPDLVDQLYRSPKKRPLRGDGATYWDQE